MGKIMNFSAWCEAREARKVCVLMRGLPGSGKSYTTDQVLKEFGGRRREGHVFSSDEFWLQDMLRLQSWLSKVGLSGLLDGRIAKKYRERWSPETVSVAHRWNFERFRQAVDAGVTPVILDSVHTKASHMRDAARYAHERGYEIVIREPGSPWWQEHAPLLRNKEANKEKLAAFAKMLAQRNQHGVPEETIVRMLARYQPDVTPEDVLRRPESPTPQS